MTVVSKSSAYPATVKPGIPRLPDCPEGWACKPLSNYLHEVRRKIKMSDDNIYRLVTVKRARGGVVVRENLAGKNISVKSQSEIKTGDFLISKRQIVHGACGLVPSELEGSIVSNEYSVLRGNGGICLNYLNYLAHSVYFQQTCFHSSIGVHVEKMIFKLDRWLSWDFLIPPLAEQKKIAKILSTWDRAIEVVEGLIENSKKQKKALMQQLLTAKKRLPGFDGEWRSALLGEIGIISSAGVDKKINTNEQTIRLLNFLDVFRRELIFDSDLTHEVTAPDAKIKNCNIQKGDVFFTPSSETRDEIAVSAVAAEDMQGVVYSYHVVRFRLEENWDLNFRSFVFQTDSFRRQAYRLGDGSGQRYVISQPNFRKMRVDIPSKEEQKVIGEILRNAAEEIEKLQNQLTQLKSEKSALMQQLLTGKRRVKIDKEAAA